jgi:hypothetical protein
MCGEIRARVWLDCTGFGLSPMSVQPRFPSLLAGERYRPEGRRLSARAVSFGYCVSSRPSEARSRDRGDWVQDRQRRLSHAATPGSRIARSRGLPGRRAKFADRPGVDYVEKGRLKPNSRASDLAYNGQTNCSLCSSRFRAWPRCALVNQMTRPVAMKPMTGDAAMTWAGGSIFARTTRTKASAR